MFVHVNKRTGEELYLVPELCYLTGLTDWMKDQFKIMKEVNAIQYTDAPLKVKENIALFDKFMEN